MTNIKLKYPITVNGSEVKELSIRRPKARDLEAMDKAPGQIGKTILLVSNLAELTPDEVREIDGEDYSVIAEHLGDFLGVE